MNYKQLIYALGCIKADINRIKLDRVAKYNPEAQATIEHLKIEQKKIEKELNTAHNQRRTVF